MCAGSNLRRLAVILQRPVAPLRRRGLCPPAVESRVAAPLRAPCPPSCLGLAPTKSSPGLARSAPALHCYLRSASRPRRLPPEPTRPMAKRRAAEPLTFHVPWKRPLLCNFAEEPPPLWIPLAAESPPGQHLGVPDLPRKRKIDAGAMTEPLGSPSKRHDCGESNAQGGAEGEGRGLETGEPSLLQQPSLRPNGPGEEPGGAQPPRGGGDNGAGRADPPRGDWGAASRQVGARGWLGSSGGGWVAGWGHHFPRYFAHWEGPDRPSPFRLIFIKTPQKAKSWGHCFRNGRPPAGNTAGASGPTLGSVLRESDGLEALR